MQVKVLSFLKIILKLQGNYPYVSYYAYSLKLKAIPLTLGAQMVTEATLYGNLGFASATA